jgi:DNA-binding HxlR family transcriptional regulator
MKYCDSDNPVNTTLKVIGGKWKPLLLWYLTQETMRFSQLQKQMSGITQKMLTQVLRELEMDQLVLRTVYPVVPPKVEYSLTDYGRTLLPVLKAMATWGEKHETIKV